MYLPMTNMADVLMMARSRMRRMAGTRPRVSMTEGMPSTPRPICALAWTTAARIQPMFVKLR